MNNQPAVSGQTAGGSKSTDFQPPTQNPQSGAASSLQTTVTTLQTSDANLPGANTNILVPTANGAIAVGPSSNQQALVAHQLPLPAHPAWLIWAGAGLAALLLLVMTLGILKHRSYQ